MRENNHEKISDSDSDSEDKNKKRNKCRRNARENGAFSRTGAFGQGFGGNPFGGGFGPAQFMQMLPLMMAMGGGMPGGGMAKMQLQLMMWMVETWLDYLSAMQEVFERAFDRLREMELCGGFMGGGYQGEDDKEW
ncbi:hypothetical protein [Paramagnetospirillum magneticum]|uniref:Uncharacterized protein n=1 Tax=Paramagnetospirillum magneticum (strain ATCC 700264 / AMB-1) TaxID=342108 RepID=Q2W5X3_PARM1|nr:hypothetical protein [Paramagnetospirillum magneticum]BAE50752.1 hypothetical protein amb1948 [Paramagnetospirillum magneticum AMB-1]